MGLDLTSFDSALKQHYTDDRVENLVYMDNPLLALMPKYESFGGRNLPIPLIYGNPQGRSAAFATAQTRGAATSTKLEDFLLTRVKDYSIATIDNETLESSKGNENAFMEAATTEIDGAINALSRSIAVKQYRDGWGDVGKIGSISSNTITLSDVETVTNFEVGQQIVVSSTQASAVLRAGSAIITNVDRDLGTITLDALSGITGETAGDFIFLAGDRQDSATPSRLVLSGLGAWIPESAPSSSAFFGVDRTVDVTRLGGLRLDASSLPIEEALIEADAKVAREGMALDHFFLSHKRYGELKKALGSKVQYVDLQANAKISFRGILVDGARGPIKVVPDQNCPNNTCFGLKLSMWKLYSLGKAVRVIDTDGMALLRLASSDGVEARYGMYAQMGCRAPGANINIKLA